MKHGIIIGIQTQKQRDIHAKNFTHPIYAFNLTFLSNLCILVLSIKPGCWNLVDRLDSGSSVHFARKGSSPFPGMLFPLQRLWN